MVSAGVRAGDPLFALREYRQLAPWNLRDLTTLTSAILEATGVRPINAAASARPTERTIRFYVTKGLVAAPDGRGTAAVYIYRHLLQVLAIKLRQMEGATLETIRIELREATGDVLERRVAAALGSALPSPTHLPLSRDDRPPSGRAGQALHVGFPSDAPDEATARNVTTWSRIQVSEGLELHVRDDHALAHPGIHERTIADVMRLAARRLVTSHDAHGPDPTDAVERPTVARS